MDLDQLVKKPARTNVMSLLNVLMPCMEAMVVKQGSHLTGGQSVAFRVKISIACAIITRRG